MNSPELFYRLIFKLSFVFSAAFVAVTFDTIEAFAQHSCRSNTTSPFVVEVSGTLSEILIDDKCEYLYATNSTNDRVEVFWITNSLIGNRRLERSISVGSRPHGLDISPDGKFLYVANFGGQSISVIDVKERTEIRRIDVPPAYETSHDSPYSIAVTNTGLVLFSTSSSSGGSRMMQADPAQDYAVTLRTDYGNRPGRTSARTILRASKDRSKVIVIGTGLHPVSIYRYDSAADDFGGVKRIINSLRDIATNRAGTWTLASPGPYALNPDFNLTGRSTYGGALGVAVHPDRKVGYLASSSGDIVVFGLDSMLPVGSMEVGDTVNVVETSRMTISPDGKLLAIITDDGFSIVVVEDKVLTPAKSVVVFSSANAEKQSLLRFYNDGRNLGSVNVTLADLDTGDVLAEWNGPEWGPGANPQVPISRIEDAAGLTFDKPPAYLATIRSNMRGKFAHVVWRPTDRMLTNLSSCGSGANAEPRILYNVHSSLLSGYYPSTINIVNEGSTSADISLGIYSVDGVKYGEFQVFSIPPASGQMVQVDMMEEEIGLVPTGTQFHYVVKVENDFPGFLQHIVDNKQAGVLTDMTHICTLPGGR